jgi:hypothetical protein
MSEIAELSLKSADQYRYTPVRFPEEIKGIGFGDGGYHIFRLEDLIFVCEVQEERCKLPGYLEDYYLNDAAPTGKEADGVFCHEIGGATSLGLLVQLGRVGLFNRDQVFVCRYLPECFPAGLTMLSNVTDIRGAQRTLAQSAGSERVNALGEYIARVGFKPTRGEFLRAAYQDIAINDGLVFYQYLRHPSGRLIRDNSATVTDGYAVGFSADGFEFAEDSHNQGDPRRIGENWDYGWIGFSHSYTIEKRRSYGLRDGSVVAACEGWSMSIQELSARPEGAVGFSVPAALAGAEIEDVTAYALIEYEQSLGGVLSSELGVYPITMTRTVSPAGKPSWSGSLDIDSLVAAAMQSMGVRFLNPEEMLATVDFPAEYDASTVDPSENREDFSFSQKTARGHARQKLQVQYVIVIAKMKYNARVLTEEEG